MVLGFLLALAHPPAPCPSPPRPVTAVARDLINAVNAGSPQVITSFVSRHWSRADTLARPRALAQLGVEHWKSRKWRALETCSATPTSLWVLVHNALSDEVDSLTLTLDSAGRPSRLVVSSGVRVEIASADTASDRARSAALRAYLARLREQGLFSGAVLIRADGGFEFSDSGGMARHGGSEAIGRDTRMNIASAGKMLTAVAVLQLVAAGSLSLEDTLGRFFPDSAIPPPVNSVSVRQLLSHTSGIRDSRTRLASSPGSAYFYSNLGFVILGELVERVSGERYEDYLREHIFRPARMDRTGRYVLSRPVGYLAMGYVPTFDETGFQLAPNELLHTLPGNAAGAIFSTASDLASFASALRSGNLIPVPLVQQMRSPQNGSSASPYGFGTVLWRAPGIWGHAGDLPGADADVEILEPRGLVVVVLSNYSGVNNPIRRRIARLWGIQARPT